MKLFTAVLVFLLVCLLSAFTGWMSGYDFNTRDHYSGFWAGLTIIIAFGFSAVYYGEQGK